MCQQAGITDPMIRTYQLREGIKIMLAYKETRLRSEWARFRGDRATIAAPSAAWTKDVKWTHLGPSSQDPISAKCISEAAFVFKPRAQSIFDTWMSLAEKSGVEKTSLLRGGGCYYAGPYQNKQIKQWRKNVDMLATKGTDQYRKEIYTVTVRPMLLKVLAEEHEMALKIFEMAMSDPEYAIGNKSPDTGTGLKAPIDKRGRLVEAFQTRNPVLASLKHDMELSNEIQQQMYGTWPEQAVHGSGFIVYAGLPGGSRDDSSVSQVTKLADGSYVWRWESDVRAVSTLPISWASNNKAMPQKYQREQLMRYKPPSYAHPMDYDTWLSMMVIPPCTANFNTGEDQVAVDMDWGMALPSPSAIVTKDRLLVTVPTEEYKSGADQLIGVGCCTTSATGFITPEMSSGRPATRRQYQASVDWMVEMLLKEKGLAFRGISNGDDQLLSMKGANVPLALEQLAPHTRMKGSKGNWVFRGGKQLYFDSPDHMYAGIMPRPTKTATTAQILKKLGVEASELSLRKDESRLFQVSEEAANAVETQWGVAPSVFFIEGKPREVEQTLRSPAAKKAVQDLIEIGIIDLHGMYFDEVEQ